MSRNFGIPRRPVPREKPLSNGAEDFLLFVFILAFLGGLMLLQLEFPNGLLDLHVALIRHP